MPLTPQKHEAILALITEKNRTAAAKACGIDRKTLASWLGEQEFAAAYAEACQKVFKQALRELLRLSNQAVEQLATNMRTPNKIASNQAAIAILQHAGRAAEMIDLEARLSALEQRSGLPPRDAGPKSAA